MSPDLRAGVVLARLATMRELLDVLAEESGVTGGDLRDDLRRRLVVERALTQLVDGAVQVNAHLVAAAGQVVPDDAYGSFLAAARAGVLPAELAARLAPSSGLRNRVIHEYEAVDLDIVAAAIADAVDGFGAYVRAIATWLEGR